MHLLSPVIGLAANVLIQVAGFRFSPKLSLLKSIMLGFAAGVVMVLFIEAGMLLNFPHALYHELDIFLVDLLIYCALGYCYFHFLNLGETARRVRILREVYDSPNGLRLEELLKKYNARAIIRYRMDRLLDNSQVVLHNGKYIISSSALLLISKLIISLKLLILAKKSEFYQG